ncbi:putative signal peptide-containing secreted [Cryptosporidium hominis]
MSVLQIILSIILIIFSLLCIFVHILKQFLQKKGFEVSFSGFFSLGNFKIKILEKYLEKYDNIGGFEFFLSKISIRFQSWKLKFILYESKCICFILNGNHFKNKQFDHHLSQYSRLQNHSSRKTNIGTDDNSIGIIRNLMLIVTAQIISRIILFELENIQFQFYMVDCKCIGNHRNLKITQDGRCEKCGIQMKYGIYSKLDINSLSIFPKAYFGGIMVNFLINNPVLYLNPIENTISEKRCHTFYLNSNNKYNSSSNHKTSILNYILNQFYMKNNETISKKCHPNQNNYPPLIYIDNNLNIKLKLMHSMSGSDIRVCILRNVNIEMNQLWITLIPEIICELVYIFHTIKSNFKNLNKISFNKNNLQVLDPNIINQSDPIIKLSPKYQLLSNNILPISPIPLAPPSSPSIISSSNSSSHSPLPPSFGNFENKVPRNKKKLIMNENLDRQLQITFKISQPSLIFCDNTQSSSGFEILFHEFEAHLIIQYFIEYLQSSLKLYNQDYDFESSNSEISDFNIIGNESNHSDLDTTDLKKKTRRSLKLVFGSKLIFGNSILYLNPKEGHYFSKQIMPNTIKDGDFTFDRMFVIEHYKSIVEISDNNFVKLYLKSSIQRMFGIWRENGFYQNLTLFLQLIKFQKYLSKIKNQVNIDNSGNSNNKNNNNNNNNEKPFVDQATEEIPKIPSRVELEDDDILKSDFLIKNNKYLKEIMTIKDFAVNLLFYLEIKDITIQTNDINCFNHELHILKKNDCSNNHCENCFIESFGPKERYEWRTDFDYESDTKFNMKIKKDDNDIDHDNHNDDKFFILKINNLKICNTSINRSFSMLFSDLDLYSMNEFIDLEDISTKYLNLPSCLKHNHDILDFQKTCIYRYGCFDQRIQVFNFEISPKIRDKNHLVKLYESIIISPWDYKRISLRFKGINGNLHTCYIPIYLYILGCFSIDCLALKKNNLNKVYYGINNQFEENFDFYCNQRFNYFEKFNEIKNDISNIIKEFNPQELKNRNIQLWNIPDLIQSKVGSLKYTWYFDFDDITINFLDGFKLLVNKLSLYRCNEYGNYDIKMNNVKIFDIFGINIINSNCIRLRSDIPYKSTKIKSPICLKKQLRRILDLSVNGDLLLLSILGNTEKSENNLKDINNGMIFFDSKRFILEIDKLDILFFVNCEYMESFFKYFYQYIYITYYQLFHPPLIIRTGKLLSFSRNHPIIFSCNNIFDFSITRMNLSLISLANFMLSQNFERFSIGSSVYRNKIYSKDDLYIQNNFKFDNSLNHKIKFGLNNIFNLPIFELKLDNLRLIIRTKHTSNSKSTCNDRECYNIPNYLTNSMISEEGFLINSSYNPINIFVSLFGISFNLYNQLNLNKSRTTIQSRKEITFFSENIVIDFRRNYSHVDSNINGDFPELSSDVKISIYSKSKTSVNISNASSFKAIKFINPIFEMIKNCPNFKSKFQKSNCEVFSKEFKNIIISRNTLIISIITSDLTSLYLVPYINLQSEREMSENSSVCIQLPKIEFYLKKYNNSHVENQEINNFLSQIELSSLFLKEGILIWILSKEIFAPVSNRELQCRLSSILNSKNQKYSLKSTLVSISKLNINAQRNTYNNFNIKLDLDGLDKKSIIERCFGNDFNNGDNTQNMVIPLTLNLDSEKLIQFSTILESFLDESNFDSISIYYCEDCNKFKPTKSESLLRSQKVLNLDQKSLSHEKNNNQPELNFKLKISLNHINLRYEIFSLIINHVLLDLRYCNSKIGNLKLGIKETQLIAEYFPYKLSQFSKSSQSFKILRGSSIQISSNFSAKTKMLEIARIGSIFFDINNNDSILLVLRAPQFSLSTLTIIYLEVLIKIINILKLKSKRVPFKNEKSSLSPINNTSSIPLIPGKKLNIQINEIMFNMHNLGTYRDYTIQRDDRKFRLGSSYSGSKKINIVPDLDTQSEFLFQVIERNPINSTFTLVDDLEESNTNLDIFKGNNGQSCLECRYHLNKALIYTSRISTDLKDNNRIRGNSNINISNCNNNSSSGNNQFDEIFKNYCNDYFSLLDEHVFSDKYQKSSFEMIQEYRRICLYTESNISIPLEYGQIIDYMILGEFGYGIKSDHISLSRSFKQIITRIPRVDCSIGIHDRNKKFEFVLKIFPVSIDVFLSNRLIWDLFGECTLENLFDINKEDHPSISPEISNYYCCRSEESFQWDDHNCQAHPHSQNDFSRIISDIPHVTKSNENFEAVTENFLSSSSSSSPPLALIEEFQSDRKRSLYDSTQEILKTTPIFVSIRIHTEKPSTQLKMYSKLLSVSIDSSRVQSINEILNSFELRNINTNKNNQSYQVSNNISNHPSTLSSSNNTTINNHPMSVLSNTMNSVAGGNLPPPIYYSHNLNPTNSIVSSGDQAQNLSSHILQQGYNFNAYPIAKTPSVLSFSNYFYDQKQEKGQRTNLMNLLNLNNKTKNANPKSNSLDLNTNRLLLNCDLNDKNVMNMLKFEIDKFLADNPLFYTVVDNIQCQAGGDNNHLNQYKLQIECIVDQLNVDIFINNKRFSNFQSKDINFVMFSNNNPSNSTIIEFDTSFIHLSANKDFVQSNGNSSVIPGTSGVGSGVVSGNNSNYNNQINCNISNSNLNPNPNNIFNANGNSIGNGNVNSNIIGEGGTGLNHNNSGLNVSSVSTIENSINATSQEEISIIHPMYIDGHTSQGHGHVLSIRINMRQVRLLEVYNIRILESVVIRVHPIRVNITQYLTSCYYDIFFPPPITNQPSMSSIQIGSNTQNFLQMSNVDSEAVSSKIKEDNAIYAENSYIINSNTNSDITIPTIEQENFSLTFNNQQPQNNNTSVDTQNCSSKNILYFNYLRISSILVEVTYRGSVSLNNVLLELSSFTQRRKHRTVKEMVDKYISFLRRQAARPVISYTFKQLRHSLLPKHFKSHKRNSNYNSHYDIIQANIQNSHHNNGNERSLKIDSSYQDLLSETTNNGNHSNYNNNINSILSKNDDELPNTYRKIQNTNCSKNDSEYNKFRLIFGNQLLI